MKTSKTNLILAALAALMPFSALSAEHANCPMAGDSGGAACCSSTATKPMTSAFAPPPPAPVAAVAGQLSEADKVFLAGYEKIHAALVSDDLSAAKAAAADVEGASAVAGATSLKEARSAFKTLSVKAIAIGRGQEGLYVIHCPMADADWIQPSKDVKNPYFGKAMPTCGVVKG